MIEAIAATRDATGGQASEDTRKWLPASLTLVGELEFLTGAQGLLWSQVQGRSYAFMLGLLERSVGASEVEPGRTPWPDDLARALAGRSTWAVLAFACQVRLLVQSHHGQCIAAGASMSPQFKDALRHHWLRQCRRGMLDELAWRREDARTTLRQKDRAVEELLESMMAVDGVLQAQAVADTHCFLESCPTASFTPLQQARLGAQMLRAYRWQFIASGAWHPRFQRVFKELTTPLQLARAEQVLRPILRTFLTGRPHEGPRQRQRADAAVDAESARGGYRPWVHPSVIDAIGAI